MKENIIFRRGNNHAWISIVWCRNGYPLQPKNGAGDKIGLATDIGYLSILYTHWYAIYITNIISTCICYVIFFVLDMIYVHTYLIIFTYIYIIILSAIPCCTSNVPNASAEQRFPVSRRFARPSAAWAACSAMLTSRTTSSNMPSSCCNASIGGRRGSMTKCLWNGGYY